MLHPFGTEKAVGRCTRRAQFQRGEQRVNRPAAAGPSRQARARRLAAVVALHANTISSWLICGHRRAAFGNRKMSAGTSGWANDNVSIRISTYVVPYHQSPQSQATVHFDSERCLGNVREIMKSPVVKRSIVINGHKTSVSLEDAFWGATKEIAAERHLTISELVAKIDHDRGEVSNLSSAVRLFVLARYRPEPAPAGSQDQAPYREDKSPNP
jgi:predicted DNA-binding ribbon-helix-helix protein